MVEEAAVQEGAAGRTSTELTQEPVFDRWQRSRLDVGWDIDAVLGPGGSEGSSLAWKSLGWGTWKMIIPQELVGAAGMGL